MPDLSGQFKDPYDKQIDERYYNAAGYRPDFSIGKSVIDAAKNLLIFSVATAGLGIASKFLGKGAKIISRKIGLTPLLKNLGADDAVNFIKKKVSSKEASGAYITYTSSYSNWKKTWDARKKQLFKSKTGPTVAMYKKAGTSADTYSKYYKGRIRDFWKPENRKARVSGKILKETGDFFKLSSTFYATDIILGLSKDKEQPSILNIPGQIGAFTRFTKDNFVSVLMGNLMLPAIGTGVGLIKKPIVQTAKAIGISQMASKSLGYIASKVPYMRGGLRGLEGVYGGLRSRPIKDITFHPIKNLKYAGKIGGEKFRGFISKTKRESPFSEIKSFIKEIDTLHGDIPDLKNRHKISLFLKTLRSKRPNPMLGVIEETLGLSKPILNKKELGQLTSNLDSRNQQWWSQLLGKLNSKGMILADKGIYKSGFDPTKQIDIRQIMPNRIFKNAVQTTNKYIQPFGIPLVSILNLDTFAKNFPKIKAMKPGDMQPIGIQRYKEFVQRGGVHEFGSGGGLFNAGRFYEYVKKGEKVSAIPVTSPSARYSLMPEGKTSQSFQIFKNLVSTHTGADARYKHEMRGKSRIETLFRDKLDIGNTDDTGIFNWARNVFSKYIREDSPLNMVNLTNQVLNKKNISIEKPFENSLRIVLGKGSSYGSGVLAKKPNILRKLGVDVSMADDILAKNVKERVGDILESKPEYYGRKLLKRYDVDAIMNKLEGDIEHRALSDVVHRTTAGIDITARENLFEFLASDNLLKRYGLDGRLKAITELTEKMSASKSLNEIEAAAVRVWAHKDEIEKLVIDNGNKMDSNLIQKIANKIKPYEKDFQLTIDKIYKPWTEQKKPIDFNSLIEKGMDNIDLARYSGYLAVPKLGTKANFFDVSGAGVFSGSPGKVSLGPVDVYTSMLTKRFNQVMGSVGLGLDMTRYKTPASYITKGILGKRVVPAIAGVTAIWYADKLLFDMNPIFDGTSLNQGLFTAAADLAVKGRIATSSIYDFTGITGKAKYLEGLMPGFVDSPLMRFTRGFAAPIFGGAAIGQRIGGMQGGALGMLAGVGVGAMQGFGLMDLTKSKEELEDIYSGREDVPVRHGRWWALSSGDFKGGRINRFRSNWYHRLKSDYRSSPELYGSPLEQMLFSPIPFLGFNPVGAILDPNHYEKRRYLSRPYPETGAPFQEFPIVGPMLASTVGNLFTKSMHKEEMESYGSRSGYTGSSSINTSNSGPRNDAMFKPNTIMMNLENTNSRNDLGQAFDSQMYNMTEAAGLAGFMTETMSNKLFGFSQPFEGNKVMANSSDMTSIRRRYWDLNLGDPFFFTELFRRFVPRPRKSVNVYNPLLNTMPSYMPKQFHTGDPFSQIPEGELMLPGSGREALYDIDKNFPVEAEMLGLSVPDTVRVMLGLYPKNQYKYHSNSTDLDRMNRETIARGTIHDPMHNVSGIHDGIVKMGRTQSAQKVKTLTDSELDTFIGPTNSDISEMNWYLHETGGDVGMITYQNQNGQAVMTHPVKYSQRRWEQDMAVIREARQTAARLEERGIGFSGESYSHIDRLKILSSVAPYSNEYKKENEIVKLQIKSGAPLQERYDKIRKQRNAIMMGEELFPYRFAGKVSTPDSEYNNLSLNENIKTASDYSWGERVIGSFWERISHADTIIHSKFLRYRTPRESYERNMLYGRNIKMWDHPMSHFMDAYQRGFMSKTTPFQGSLAGFMGGLIMGGPGLPSAIGAVAGGIYGSVHGMYRKATGTTYIPKQIQEARKINRYFDTVSYTKNMMLYSTTGDESFKEKADATMIGLVPSDRSLNSWSNIYRATPPQERPYIMKFMQELDPEERRKILNEVPSSVGEVLKVKWAKADNVRYSAELSNDISTAVPGQDWVGYDPSIPIEDVKVKYLENKGLNPKDFGVGFADQMNRINSSPWLDNISIDMGKNAEPKTPLALSQNSMELRTTLENAIKSFDGNASVTITPSYTNNVNIVNV